MGGGRKAAIVGLVVTAAAAIAIALGAKGETAPEPGAGPLEAGVSEGTSRPTAADTIPALRETTCPPRYEVARTDDHPAAELAAARRGRFEVEGVPTRLRPPVNWSLNTGRSRAFRHQLHKMKWSDVLFSAYRDGDLAALLQARDLFADWVRSNPLGGPRTPPAAWADKRTGDRGPYMAYLLRAGACEGILGKRLQRELLASLRVHVSELLNPAKYKPTNHGLFEDLGLALLARQLSFAPDADRWTATARRRFRGTLLRRLVPSEGYWLEHSSSYQVLLTKLVERFSEVPGIDAGGLGRIRARMEDVTAWLTMPDGRLVQFGDSDRDRAPSYVAPIEAKARGLLALPRSGLAVVKEPGSFLGFTASFHNSTHKHSDELSFDLYDRGTRIVSDTGLYNKDLGRAYEFAASARAHSGLVIDGVEPRRTDGAAYGSGLLATGEGEGWYALLGRNPLAREQGVGHHRLLLYRPGEALIVIDSLRAERRHSYLRRFQLGKDIEVERAGDRLLLAAPELRGGAQRYGSRRWSCAATVDLRQP